MHYNGRGTKGDFTYLFHKGIDGNFLTRYLMSAQILNTFLSTFNSTRRQIEYIRIRDTYRLTELK